MAAKGCSASKWAYALRSRVHRVRKQARRMPFAQLYFAMQSVSQMKFLSTMPIRGLLDGGSVTKRLMRAFAVASEMGRWRWQVLSPIRQWLYCLA